MEIQIDGLGGRLCTIISDVGWLLCDLKQAIEDVTGIPSFAQCLLFGSQQLTAAWCTLSMLLGDCQADAVALTLVRMPAIWCRLAGFQIRGNSPNGERMTVEEAKERCASLGFHCFSARSVQNESDLVEVYFEEHVDKEKLACDWRSRADWNTFLLLEGSEERSLAVDAIERAYFDPLQLETASDEVRSDRQLVLASVAKDGRRFQHASSNLRGDLQVVSTATQKSASAMQYVCSEFLKHRPHVVLLAQGNGMIVRYLQGGYATDKELWIGAAQQDNDVILHAPKEMCGVSEFMILALPDEPQRIQRASQVLLKDPAFCLSAVCLNGEVIRYFDDHLRADRELALQAICQCPAALQHVSEQLRTSIGFCHEAVRENRSALKYIPEVVWNEAWQSLGVTAQGQRIQAVRSKKPAIEPHSSRADTTASTAAGALKAVRLMHSQPSHSQSARFGIGKVTLVSSSAPAVFRPASAESIAAVEAITSHGSFVGSCAERRSKSETEESNLHVELPLEVFDLLSLD